MKEFDFKALAVGAAYFSIIFGAAMFLMNINSYLSI